MTLYVGSQNTNCLIYTPKNVNIELDPLNAQVYNNLTVNNGVASGFSAENVFGILNDAGFNTTGKDWEIVIKFMLTGSSSGCLISPNSAAPYGNVLLYVSATSFGWYMGSNNSEWNIVSGNLSTTLSLNTPYWVKMKYSHSSQKYTLELSTNGEDYNILKEATSSLQVYQNQSFRFGKERYNNLSPFTQGSIDISQSYIKIGNEFWWKGGTGNLTLKASGSKVYVPNSKNDDGSNKFDELVLGSDLSFTHSGTATWLGFIKNDGSEAVCRHVSDCYSGESDTGASATAYYLTNSNVINYRYANGNQINVSLPVCIFSTVNGVVTSINQIFDWCGYIGSTAFVLPGVKGLIPNGFNTDGTYKNIEFETSGVVTTTFTETQDNVDFVLQGTTLWARNQTVVKSASEIGTATGNYYITDENRYVFSSAGVLSFQTRNVIGKFSLSSGRITSLTPYTTQPLTTLIKIKDRVEHGIHVGGTSINQVYSGSDLVYQYHPYEPETVFVESAGAKTLTVTLKKGVYYVEVTGGGASMTYGFYYLCFMNGGGSGASCYGEFYNPKEQTFTLYAGGGGSTFSAGVAGYLNVGDTRIITANGGNYCHANGACGGNTGGTGVLDFSSGLIENISVTAHTGNKGGYADQGVPAAAASVSPHGWGKGGTGSACADGVHTPGGIFLKYVRATK